MQLSITWYVRSLLLGSAIGALLNAYLDVAGLVPLSTSNLIQSAVFTSLVCIHMAVIRSPWWMFYMGMVFHHASCIYISSEYPGFVNSDQQLVAGCFFLLQYLAVWGAEKLFK